MRPVTSLLWDASGSRVVGALHVGKKQESVTSLEARYSGYRHRQERLCGRFFGAQASSAAHYSPSSGKRNGENIFKGDDPKLVFRLVIDMVFSLGGDQHGTAIPTLHYKYPWQNPGEDQPRRKSASPIAYFEPWDWIIVATAYDDDYAQSRQRIGLASALSHMIECNALGGGGRYRPCRY
ncbi:MAG: Cache 3/Cache 2 fusion domain-containing protein [Syntrophotaleaceae bacterium]